MNFDELEIFFYLIQNCSLLAPYFALVQQHFTYAILLIFTIRDFSAIMRMVLL